MPNALIIYVSGNNSSAALASRLDSKGYKVHRIKMTAPNGGILWGKSNGQKPTGKLLGSIYYDKVFLIGHHGVVDRLNPTTRGIGSETGLLSNDIIIGSLFRFGLQQPKKIILILCKASNGSNIGNAKDDDIGYSTGHNFASRLAEINWFNVEVHAYTSEVGVIDEAMHKLFTQLAATKSSQPYKVLPIGSRYLPNDADPYRPHRPRSTKNSKMRFYFQNQVLCCGMVY
ncbi:MAG TPA: hypothetical protein VL995_19545 [Cellvibrio sp.]|nr:hypothetical protein [Cellvibrio sp.]